MFPLSRICSLLGLVKPIKNFLVHLRELNYNHGSNLYTSWNISITSLTTFPLISRNFKHSTEDRFHISLATTRVIQPQPLLMPLLLNTINTNTYQRELETIPTTHGWLHKYSSSRHAIQQRWHDYLAIKRILQALRNFTTC